MDAELLAYDVAWRNTAKEERNALCQRLADDYVLAHPELQAKYGGLTIPQLVALVDVARAAGDEEERIRLDIWINAAYEYQTIGGAISTDGKARPLESVPVDGTPRQLGG